MNVEINIWGVILATIASMVVGSIWYAPPVFGNLWMKLIGKSQKELPGGFVPIILAVVVSAMTAYVLAHVSYLSNQFFQNSFLQDSLTTAFWMWLGFTAARFITHDSFEGRPVKLTFLTLAHELVTLEAMALAIGLVKP